MREISQQLGKLKKKHDVVKKQVNAMENNLSKVKKEIDGLLVQEAQAEQNVYETSTRVEQIEKAIETTRGKMDEEEMGTHIYAHMMERMKKDTIAFSIKRKELEGSLRNKEIILGEELERKRRCKENQLQSQNVFNALMKNIGDEQSERKK